MWKPLAVSTALLFLAAEPHSAQGQAPGPAAALPVPAAITARHVPPIDPASLEGVEPYQSSRAARFEAWHPTERRMLIGTRFAESRQLHEVAFPGGDRSQLTFFRDPVAEAKYRPGRPHEIALRRDTGGDENFQVYLLDRTNGRTRRLSDGTHRYENLFWSADGSTLAYTSNARNGRDTDVYVQRPDDTAGGERRAAELEGSWQIADWATDGRRLLIFHFVSADESWPHALDLATGGLTRLVPESDGPASYTSLRWSADGRAVYAATNRGGDLRRLARLDLATGRWTTLSAAIDWDVENLDLSDDGKILAFFTNEDGASRPHLLDTATGRELSAPELPLGVGGPPSFRPGSHEVAFTLSWARSPTDVYSFDPGTAKLERWTTSEIGGLDAATFVLPELVRFPTFDRLISGAPRTIPAFVHRPDPGLHPGRRPVLISIHGGPEGQARPSFLASFNFMVNELGIAVVQPNVRGSTGYGRAYLALDDGRKREDSVRDLGALLDWIATQPDLDSSRVVVAGGSYGGYMTLAALTLYGERLAGGYDSVGISNFVTFLTNTEDYRRDLRRVEYGDERDPEMRRFLTEISPATRVERINKPLLVAQGANDPRVPKSESDQIVAALEARGTPVWYVVAADEGHGFRKKSNTDYMQAVFIEFLRRTVGSGKAPSP